MDKGKIITLEHDNQTFPELELNEAEQPCQELDLKG